MKDKKIFLVHQSSPNGITHQEESTSTKCNILENSCNHSTKQNFTDLQNASLQIPFISEKTVPSDCSQGLLLGVATKLLLSPV